MHVPEKTGVSKTLKLKTLFVILALAYIVFPRDLLPDWFIGLGWIDDLIVLYFLWRFFLRGRVTAGTGGHRTGGPGGTQADRPGQFQKKNPYDVLGIEPDASQSDIRRAYRTLANKYHPDKSAHLGPEFQALAEEKFKEIQAAYDVLTKGDRHY